MTTAPPEALGGIPSERWSLTEATTEHHGLRLHHLDLRRTDAEAGAPTAVLLHGMTAHADSWRPLVSRLAVPGRVVCPDLRGHGLSDWSRDGYWLRDYAADVLTLVDELGLDELHLVGHSLGARVSMVLAPLLGDRLASLVLSDTGPEVSRTAAQQALAVNASASGPAGFRDLDRLRAFLREQQPDWTEEAIEVRAHRLYRQNWAGMLVNRGDPEVTWLLGRAGLAEVADMWDGLHRTTAPTLILKATRSFLLDDELTARMADALRQVAVARLDLGHYLPYEDPDAIAALLDRFLTNPGAVVADP